MSDSDFEAIYSENSFWDKVKNHARAAGETVLEPALKLYYSATDPDTPTWAKTAIYGALGYFITPIDAILDITPGVGYTDDLGVLRAATATVAAYIKKEHEVKARQTLLRWFG